MLGPAFMEANSFACADTRISQALFYTQDDDNSLVLMCVTNPEWFGQCVTLMSPNTFRLAQKGRRNDERIPYS